VNNIKEQHAVPFFILSFLCYYIYMEKISRYPITISLVIFTGLIYLILGLQIANSQKIAWGVRVAGFNLGRNTPQIAQGKLKEQWDNFAEQDLTFRFQDKNWSVKLADLGFQFNEAATINQAYQIGHQANILTNLKEQLIALLAGYQLEPIYKIDQGKFQEKTAQLFKDIERPVQNASLIFNQEIDDFSLQHSTKGATVNREQLLFDLSQLIKSFSLQSINLQVIINEPTVENNEVDSAQQKARQILADQSYQIILEQNVWAINRNQLIDWIKFEPISEDETDNQILGLFLDNNQVKEYLEEITSTINQQPVNARLETEGNRAIVFTQAQEGYGLDIDKTIEQLIQNILAEPPVKKTNIFAQKLLPRIALWQTNNLGIKSLIGQGASNFAGSPKNRIHNIKTGTAKFNGLILNPGEEFSFNTLLGGSGAAQGFLPELVIKKAKLVPEYGGGLCQVSTTLFRAAVNSGLEITQRSPHAFPVEYYSPQGFDATVYEPRPDFRFINNTPTHLLIEGLVQGNKLTFNFYATDDNRQVKIKGPYVLEKKQDGSMKTILTQEVYKNGELFSEQTFHSNYASPNLYQVGN